MVNARFVCGPLEAFMESFEWGYYDETQYLERNYGNAGYGRMFRQKVSQLGGLRPIRRVLNLKFIKTDKRMDALRALSYQAQKTSDSVILYTEWPATTVGTVFKLDWAPSLEISRDMENRQTVEVLCVGRPFEFGEAIA